MTKLLALVVVLGGCNLYFSQPSNNPPSPPGGGGGIGAPDANTTDGSFVGPGGAYTEFVQNVYPILSSQCFGCHLGASTNPLALFGAAADPSDVYAAVIDDPALTGCWVPGNSELLTKGAHEGPALTVPEQALITEWLDDESVVTAGTAPGCTSPSDPALVAEEQFAACETVSGNDITTTGVVAEFNNLTSSEGTCGSCHTPGGAGGFYLGSASQMLSAWETQVGLEAVFVPEQNAAGSYVVTFDESRFVAKGMEQQDGDGTHPSFAVPQALLTDMASFVTDIATLENEAVCPAPSFY